jgi:hypothetical protein
VKPHIRNNTITDEDRIMFYPPFAPPIAFDVNDLLTFLDANDAHPLVLARLMGLGHLDGCSARQWANLGRALNMPEIADMSDDAFSAIVLGILGEDAGRGFMKSREGLGG